MFNVAVIRITNSLTSCACNALHFCKASIIDIMGLFVLIYVDQLD